MPIKREEEYRTLRDEQLQYLNLVPRLQVYTLVGYFTILGLGLKETIPITWAVFFSLVLLLLSALYVFQVLRGTFRIGAYIMHFLENEDDETRWVWRSRQIGRSEKKLQVKGYGWGFRHRVEGVVYFLLSLVSLILWLLKVDKQLCWHFILPLIFFVVLIVCLAYRIYETFWKITDVTLNDEKAWLNLKKKEKELREEWLKND
ncbi:MAG TPA: hypothetical protein EYP79_01780 [Campylobacterales bacterium]|nr:hypothetical protein [Campylobacterales bacterium]